MKTNRIANKVRLQLFAAMLVSLSLPGVAQSRHQTFQKLYAANDSANIKLLLQEWESADPGDPELYTSAMNYYFFAAKQEIVSLETSAKSKDGLQLLDSTGKPAGYMNSSWSFRKDMLDKAFRYANTGIQKFPDRLDIRFGKCFLYQQVGDYDNFTKELITDIEYSQVNKNNWLWSGNQKQQDGEGFFLGTVQTYLKEMFDTEDDRLLSYMIQIGETTLKYYGNSVEILSTTAVALMLTKNYDKALEYLKKAETINPKDFIVLNNIAQAYKFKADKGNAIKYFQLTEKYGDAQAKKQARQSIKELNK